MVSSLILLRSLLVHILIQLFFSISVNSGFGNIYLDFREYYAYAFSRFVWLHCICRISDVSQGPPPPPPTTISYVRIGSVSTLEFFCKLSDRLNLLRLWVQSSTFKNGLKLSKRWIEVTRRGSSGTWIITGVVPNSHKAGTTFYDIPFPWWKNIIETD